MENQKNGIIKQIFGYSLASWFSAALSFIVVPISSHLYSADDLGKINFFLSVASICYTLLCLGLDQGYIRFYSTSSEKMRRRMMSFNLLMVFSMLLLVTLVLVVLWKPASNWLFGEENRNLLLMLPCYVAGLLILRFVSTHYRMSDHLPRYTFLTILLGLATKGIYLISAPIEQTYQTAINCCGVAGIILLVLLILTHKRMLTFPAVREEKLFYLSELRFSLPLIPAMLMSLLNNNIPQFMLRTHDGFVYLAGYAVAVTVATALNVIQTGFNTFWTPYVFRNHESKQSEIQQIHGYIVTLMTLVAMGIALFQDIIFLVVNEEYRYITQYLPFLILTPLCYTIGETTCVGIALYMKTGYNIAIYTLSAIVNCICCLILIPKLGANGGAVSAAAGALTALTLKTVLGQKFYKSISSFWPMVINITVFVAMASWNMIMFLSPLRYVGMIVAIVLFCILPHNFVVFKTVLEYIKKTLRLVRR